MVHTMGIIHETFVNIGVNSEQFAHKTDLPEHSPPDSQKLSKLQI